MIVSYLPEPESHPLWNDIKALLEPAVLDGEIVGPGEIVWIAFEGQYLFGAGTTALSKDERTAIILACGGYEHRKWVKQAECVVSAWARTGGAEKLTMRGRKGWARYFRAFGWDASQSDDGKTVYEKDLRG